MSDAAARAYLAELSSAMTDSYLGDCLVHAKAIAETLAAEGEEPWLGRVRNRTATFHGPLTPLRYRGRNGPTWTTHYVCCCNEFAYDPLAGVPLPLDRYAREVFGLDLAVERIPF